MHPRCFCLGQIGSCQQLGALPDTMHPLQLVAAPHEASGLPGPASLWPPQAPALVVPGEQPHPLQTWVVIGTEMGPCGQQPAGRGCLWRMRTVLPSLLL